jgi:hypothetical protein
MRTFFPGCWLNNWGKEDINSVQITSEKKHRVIFPMKNASNTIRAIAAAAQRIETINTNVAHLRARWQQAKKYEQSVQ